MRIYENIHNYHNSLSNVKNAIIISNDTIREINEIEIKAS